MTTLDSLFQMMKLMKSELKSIHSEIKLLDQPLTRLEKRISTRKDFIDGPFSKDKEPDPPDPPKIIPQASLIINKSNPLKFLTSDQKKSTSTFNAMLTKETKPEPKQGFIYSFLIKEASHVQFKPTHFACQGEIVLRTKLYQEGENDEDIHQDANQKFKEEFHKLENSLTCLHTLNIQEDVKEIKEDPQNQNIQDNSYQPMIEDQPKIKSISRYKGDQTFHIWPLSHLSFDLQQLGALKPNISTLKERSPDLIPPLFSLSF